MDEDEAAARRASNAPWTALTFFPTRSEVTNETEIDGGVIVRTPSKDDADVDHIARHDPARVLAQVAATRAIVEALVDMEPVEDERREQVVTLRWVARHLASVYASHPEFDSRWAV